jgi:hypothetical protein
MLPQNRSYPLNDKDDEIQRDAGNGARGRMVIYFTYVPLFPPLTTLN